MPMGLTDDELRDVLSRAEEIQRASGPRGESHVEVASVIAAAEDIGLSRYAIERALSERLNLFTSPPAPGALTWARSADGKFYVARVVSASDQDARVRFLRGTEHLVGLDQLRRCAFIPGERVACNWPMWGPWVCTVVAYDPETQHVKLNDGWGYTKGFPISEVWLAPPKAEIRARRRVYLTLLAAGAGVGALVGSVITTLLLRS
jgi:hypothetical protein